MKKGYYQVTEALQAAAEAATLVNQVSWGSVDEQDLINFSQYPFVHFVNNTATFVDNVTIFNFTMIVAEAADVSKDKDLLASADQFFQGVQMKQDIYHRTLYIIKEVLDNFKRGTQYDNDIQLIGEPTCESFNMTNNNGLCGWTCEFEVQAPNPIIIC